MSYSTFLKNALILLPILIQTFCENGTKCFLKIEKYIENKNLIKSYFFNCSSVPPKQILGQLKYFPVLGYDFQANFCVNNDDKIEAF